MIRTADDTRERILEILGGIAPEVDWSDVRGDENLRDQVDLDSMDFLNFVVALHDDLGVSVPEKDYGELFTLDGCVAYVAARTRLPDA